MSSFHTVPTTNTATQANSALPDAPIVDEQPSLVRRWAASALLALAQAQVRLARKIDRRTDAAAVEAIALTSCRHPSVV